MDLLKTAPWEKPYRFRSYGLQKIFDDDDELPDLTQTAPYAKTDSPYGSLYAPTAYTARQNTDTPTKPPESEPTPKTKEAEDPQFSFGTAAKNFGQAALNGFNNTFYGIGSAIEDFFIAPIVEFGGDIAQTTAITAGADPQGEWGKEAADAVRFMRKGKEFTERQQQAVSQEAEENIGRIKNKTAREIASFAQNDVAPSMLTAAVSAMAAPYVAAASAVPSTQSLTQAAHLAQNPTLVNKATAWLSKQFGSPNYWISFGQEYVGEYDRAIADGETPEKAALLAANTATLNALVENSGGYQTLPDDVGDIASRSGKRGLRKWVKAILDEGYEEVVQDIISRTVEKIGYRSETPLFSTTDGKAIINPSRLLRDFLGGAAVASIIAGGETAVDNAVNGAQVSNILPQMDAKTTAASTQTVANAESGVYNGAVNLTPQEQVAVAADTLGEAGKAVLVRQFNSKSDATQYTLGMTAIYEAGKSSVTKEPLTLTREAKDAMSSITLPQHEAIFEAGVKDAKQELASGERIGHIKNEMPNHQSAVTPREKFIQYSLDYDNPKATGKPEAYEKGLGYTKSNADDLIKQIHISVTSGNVKPYAVEKTEYGVKYKYRIPVTGPNGKTKTVVVVYQIDFDDTKPRMITNYLEGK